MLGDARKGYEFYKAEHKGHVYEVMFKNEFWRLYVDGIIVPQEYATHREDLMSRVEVQLEKLDAEEIS